jgi:hypothetical protein
MRHHKQLQGLRNKEKVLITAQQTALPKAGKGSCVPFTKRNCKQAVQIEPACYKTERKKVGRATLYPIVWVPASVNKQ